MFRKQNALALIVALAMTACTSIRVTGFVTDEATGEPVPGCGISFGSFYVNTDAAGHYAVKGRKSWGTMQLVASGYETKSVTVDASETRYPVVNVQLTRKKTLAEQETAPPATR